MRLPGKTRTAISLVVLSISILAWVLLLANPGDTMTVVHCHVSDSGSSAASFQMLLTNPIPFQLTGWGLMVIAMMLPKLILPIRYIYGRSLKRRRFPSALFFVFGYMTVWMAVGIVMMAVMSELHLLMPDSYLPAIGMGIIAIVWQFSPVKQRCLNRGHDHWTLAAFGWPAYCDPILFGVMHGVWCVGSGWALMLLPMLLPDSHNPAMVFATFIMLSEHLEHPKAPRWRIDFRGKLLRIIVAQTRIRLERALG